MSALSDPNSVNLTRNPDRDGNVRLESWWQELTGLGPPPTDGSSESEDGTKAVLPPPHEG